MSQWLECSPPSNVARVQITASTPYVGWVWVRFLGKSKSGFPNPKTDFAFFWANPKTDHESIKSTLRVDSWDQIQIRISESKNGFCVFWGKSKNGSWIHKIHTQGGFLGSNPNPDFWDSQSDRFSRKWFEKSTFDKRVFEKKKKVRNRWRTCMTF